MYCQPNTGSTLKFSTTAIVIVIIAVNSFCKLTAKLITYNEMSVVIPVMVRLSYEAEKQL
jgi:hypothetical protein